jgi:hypothetical protein
MPICNKCGKSFKKGTGVFRIVKTGSYSSGKDYYRNVNLCDQCDTNQDDSERSQKSHKIWFFVAAVVALVGSCAYVLFFR